VVHKRHFGPKHLPVVGMLVLGNEILTDKFLLRGDDMIHFQVALVSERRNFIFDSELQTILAAACCIVKIFHVFN